MSGSPHTPLRPNGAHARPAPASASAAASDPWAGDSYLSAMWTGLIRRFSSEDGHFGTLLDASDESHEHPPQPGKDGVHGVFAPAVRRASPFRPPPLDPLVLHGYRDSTPASARLLTVPVAEEIRTMVPERLRIVEDWRLVYSLDQDGASLATLYQACRCYEGRRVGFILVVKDQEGGTFGAYLSEHPRPAPSYFGNGPTMGSDSMTNNFEPIRFKAFPYSGLNDCYINCETGFFSVGSGGGHYGLWLDDSLDIGHSSQCETFGNEPLSDVGEKFCVWGVELWVVGA